MDELEHNKVHIRRAFITGFVALFPIVLTVFVLYLCWRTIEELSKPLGDLVRYTVSWTTGIESGKLPEGVGTLVALALAVLFVYVLGWSLAGLFGRQLMVWMETLFSKLPIVRYIYPHAKELSDFLFGRKKIRFNRVVAIEYPRKGIYTIGFATGDGIDGVSRRTGRRMIAVFVPTSPTPFTGWTVLVDENEVLPVDMTVDEAVRFIVTCGVLVPGDETIDELPSATPLPPVGGESASEN